MKMTGWVASFGAPQQVEYDPNQTTWRGGVLRVTVTVVDKDRSKRDVTLSSVKATRREVAEHLLKLRLVERTRIEQQITYLEAVLAMEDEMGDPPEHEQTPGGV